MMSSVEDAHILARGKPYSSPKVHVLIPAPVDPPDAFEAKQPKTPDGAGLSVLLLRTENPGHAGRSGYSMLAEYMPGSEVLTAERTHPRTALGRAIRFASCQIAITSWYQLASASLEWRAWRRIRKGFRGVVHVLWADSDLGVLDLLLTPKAQALCCTFHQTPDLLRRVIQYPDRLKRIQRVILMSSNQIQYFVDCGVGRESISVIPHGVDTGYFAPKAAPASTKFVVLSVGSYRRNFSLLRDVCERMISYPQVEFQIITAPAFHRLFKGLANVVCRTNVADDELLESYQSASCYLMTADDATANNALLESMSCGLPIVAERVGGIPEYTTNGCAFLTQPGNAAQIVEAILALKESAGLCRQKSDASRRRALELDWSNVATLTRSVYSEISPE